LKKPLGQYIARSTAIGTLLVDVTVVATAVSVKPGMSSTKTLNRLCARTV
jgi:hypothetical protein